MRSLLLDNRAKIFFLAQVFLIFPGVVLLLSACMQAFNFGGASGHCSQYTYDNNKQAWVDNSGQIVQCSIVDNNRIYPYVPGQGCDHWRKLFQHDPTVKFAEVPINAGGKSAVAQTYCVKQRYLSKDHSGQVLLIDEGIFCLRSHPTVADSYVFQNCQGVERANPALQKNN